MPVSGQLKRVARIDTKSSTRDLEVAAAGHAFSAEIGAAQADLERLDAVLVDAAGKLLECFGAIAELSKGREEFALPLGRAATALQFQDLASQLIAHTRSQLAACARAVPADKPRQPVRQHGLDEGSVELF
jgi:hypothetical protein